MNSWMYFESNWHPAQAPRTKTEFFGGVILVIGSTVSNSSNHPLIFHSMVRLLLLEIFHPVMLSKQTSSKLTFSYFLLYKRGRVKNYKHVWVSQQYALICTTCTIVHSHQLFLVSVSLAKIVKNVLQTSNLMLTFSVIKAVYNLQKFVLKKLKFKSEFLMVLLKFMSEF